MDSTEASSYNQWKETVKFFNSKVGQTVTRFELRHAVKHKRRRHHPLTIDTYRSLLEKAGYLKHPGLGTYFVVKQIPEVSSTLMREYINKTKPFHWLKFWGTLEDYLEYRRSKKLCS